MMTRAKLLS